MVIEGKIVRILSPEKVLISVGERDGVKTGMNFTIYERGEEIFDQETGESLGHVEYKKADVKIENTMEKLSIATSYYIQIPTILSSGLTTFSSLAQLLYTPVKSQLPIDLKDINPIAPPDTPYIKVGDPVRQRIELASTEPESDT